MGPAIGDRERSRFKDIGDNMEFQDLVLKTLVRLYRDRTSNGPLQLREWIEFSKIGLALSLEGDFWTKGDQQTPEQEQADGERTRNLLQAVEELRLRGLVDADQAVVKINVRLRPTKEGLDRVDWLMRPWYRKMFDLYKGDVRTIIVSVITAVITTIVLYFILRALG